MNGMTPGGRAGADIEAARVCRARIPFLNDLTACSAFLYLLSCDTG
jgi:hypothetical protein